MQQSCDHTTPCQASELDAKSSYWQLKLTEQSLYLTTFNTPFGRYQFCRLRFGVISAQDDFQQKMDEIFEGIPVVTPLMDNIIVSGTAWEDHDANLKQHSRWLLQGT